ncbi:hypothetical protein AAY473_020611 [Plecturocebus cupreus]
MVAHICNPSALGGRALRRILRTSRQARAIENIHVVKASGATWSTLVFGGEEVQQEGLALKMTVTGYRPGPDTVHRTRPSGSLRRALRRGRQVAGPGSDTQHYGRPRRVDCLRSGVEDQTGQHSETLSLLNIQKIIWVWWCTPTILATQEAEAGELLEPRRQRLQEAALCVALLLRAKLCGRGAGSQLRLCPIYHEGDRWYHCHLRAELACTFLGAGMVAHAYNPSTLGDRCWQILGPRVQDQPGQHSEIPSLSEIQKIHQVCWCAPVVPDAWEAEVGGPTEPRRRITRSRDRDLPDQLGETLSLLKIQKLAGQGGAHLYSQLLERLKQENRLNLGGRDCTSKTGVGTQQELNKYLLNEQLTSRQMRTEGH